MQLAVPIHMPGDCRICICYFDRLSNVMVKKKWMVEEVLLIGLIFILR